MLRFGTDGVRGVANRDLTPELVLALGRATARAFGSDRPLLIARDTRRSGPMLEAALAAGVCAEGAGVRSCGVLPTPGVAHLSNLLEVPAAMISASHNPFPDNGIKLFAAGGRKLSSDVEARIESELVTVLGRAVPADDPTGEAVGPLTQVATAVDRYVDHLVDAIGGRSFGGRRVVLDCANGAAAESAPKAFERLGADVVAVGVEPDGTNINEGCGSTHPAALQAAVEQYGADIGFAFDGDADRCLAVDETGAIVDGDHVLAVMALDRRRAGRLPGDAVVTTVMANLGLRQLLAEHGITAIETPVGDRHVLEAMEEWGLALGGEQSGHVIFADHATTGDGTLTAILLLDAACRSGERLHDLASVLEKLPQVLRNVPMESPEALEGRREFWEAVRDAEAELGAEGRVLVRPSGTEPLVRIMVEAASELQATALAERLVEVTHRLGAGQ